MNIASWTPFREMDDFFKRYRNLMDRVGDDEERGTSMDWRKMNKEEKDATKHRIESFYGSFSRSFSLPADVDETKISAKSENGVLKVHLPKTKVSKPKQVEIDVK